VGRRDAAQDARRVPRRDRPSGTDPTGSRRHVAAARSVPPREGPLRGALRARQSPALGRVAARRGLRDARRHGVAVTPGRAPTSTYRLQVSPRFTLDDVAATADYIRSLGADWLYL